MKKTVKLYSLILTAGIIFVLSAAQNAAADPIAFDLNTGNDGLSLKYTLPFFGDNEILLEKKYDIDSIVINIFIIQLANIQLTHNGLSDNGIIDAIDIGLKMSFFFGIFNFPPIELPVPFGVYAMEVDLFGTERTALEGNEDMGVSFLLGDSYEHEIIAKGLPFIDPIDEDGTDSEFTVPVTGEPLIGDPIDFDLNFSLSPFWIPFLTLIEIQVDDNTEKITIPLPNGAYFLSLTYPDPDA